LSLIRALLLKPGVIAFVVNPNNTGTALQVEEMQQAARMVGQPLVVVRVANEAPLALA
jgi:hypothetical protein